MSRLPTRAPTVKRPNAFAVIKRAFPDPSTDMAFSMIFNRSIPNDVDFVAETPSLSNTERHTDNTGDRSSDKQPDKPADDSKEEDSKEEDCSNSPTKKAKHALPEDLEKIKTDKQRLSFEVLMYIDKTDPQDELIFIGPLIKYDPSDRVYRQFALLEKDGTTFIKGVSQEDDYHGLVKNDLDDFEECVDELADFFSMVTSSIPVKHDTKLLAPKWLIEGKTSLL